MKITDNNETSENPGSNYLKGFNEGYLIGIHLPTLSDKLSSSLSNSERSQGFAAGRLEAVQEINQRMNVNRPAWLNPDRLSSARKDIPFDRDAEKKDPDRD